MIRKYTNQLSQKHEGKRVTIAGWVHEIRDLGGLMFILVRDREGIIQVTLNRSTHAEMMDQARIVSRESVVKIRGRLRSDPRAPRGLELIPEDFQILSLAQKPLPLDPSLKVPADLDTRFDHRFLDLRIPKVQAIFKLRSQLCNLIRGFLLRRGFIEVHTPKIICSATEGGASLFPISYFEREAFLAQSPQIYKQMMIAAGLDKVFEIGPIFRAEEHDTSKHLNEAVCLDVEMGFADHRDVMRLLEDLIVYIHRKLRDRALDLLEIDIGIPSKPFPRLKYAEVVDMLSGKMSWGQDIGSELERELGKMMGNYYFIVDWPTKLKPYYIQPYPDSELCMGFDLMHPKVEIASGGARVHDPEMLIERLREQNLDPGGFKYYLEAFRYGIPPHAGWGLGIERLIMAMLDLKNIREACLFPRDRRRLVP